MSTNVSALQGAGLRYMLAKSAKTYLNMDAIFSDETKQYVEPYDPDSGEVVTFTLRTAKNNVDSALFHTSRKTFPMSKIKSDGLFDYYAAKYRLGKEVLRYYFSVDKNGSRYFYNKNGLHSNVNEDFNFKIVPGFRTPDWAKGAIMYQIFIDRFYNGDKTNDPLNYEYLYIGRVCKSLAWDHPVETDDICNFYGGDLQGIIDKMPYLQSLGVEALYLSPLFVSPSSHKYDIQDYDYVDPHFGVIKQDGGQVLNFDRFHNRYATKYMARTAEKVNLEASNELCIKMIETAHAHGIKVILDGVFNHCGCYNKWLDKPGFYKTMGYPDGAYRSESSQYNKYFLWYDTNWPNNDCYDSWWGNDNHPKLNFEDAPELYDYILEVGKKWVSPPYNIDGWRLDVAADLGRSPEFNHKFWQDFRKAVKSANPNAIILAEHYGDVSPWISGGEWDTVMNYDAFMEPLTWFLTGVSKHSEEHQGHLKCNAMAFENAMRYHMSRFNVHALQVSMNQLSNHDHSRFLTRTNGETGRLHTRGGKAAEDGVHKAVMMEAVVFQMTWPGAPTIYYGDEAGLAGWTDPDNRRVFPWGKEDKTMLQLHRDLAELRQSYPVLRGGSVEFLWNEYGILSFARWDESAKIAVAINNNDVEKSITLPVWKMGCRTGEMTCILATFDKTSEHWEEIYKVDKTNEKSAKKYAVESGIVHLTLPPFSSIILAE
ncbi:MAG: glycoside hydrolase family 13 protein [Firmicutes bacterium]|nr:glycoside hydrolase family 13 protein [Bacillota bacterium]